MWEIDRDVGDGHARKVEWGGLVQPERTCSAEHRRAALGLAHGWRAPWIRPVHSSGNRNSAVTGSVATAPRVPTSGADHAVGVRYPLDRRLDSGSDSALDGGPYD